MAEYKFWDGSRLTPYTYWQLERLDKDLATLFGVRLRVVSGIRLHQEQIDIFLKRYVLAGEINGRRVYDTRWWQGRLYYRIDRTGTVAQPGTSNHEIQGDDAAVDIFDTGQDAGITDKNSRRGKWIRANAAKYGLEAEGDNFEEGWHFKTLDIYREIPITEAGKELPMFVNIAGKRGVRRGGIYLVQSDSKGGLYATFIGGRTEKNPGRIPMFTNETEIARLQKQIRGLK